MKLNNSKKARENWPMDTMPYWMVFTIILGFTAIFFLWIITPFVAKTAEIPEGVESYILMQRFVNSQNCFAYTEEDTERVYQKLIDWEKFTDENMEKCYQTDDKRIAFKLILPIPGNDITRSVRTSNWRESYLVKERQFKGVFVKYGEAIYKTRMIVDVQNA